MLSRLQIENIATISEACVDFSSGLNILTGETGAGKSILIDSINAVSGAKTSRDIIRTGSEFSYVSALFTDISGETKEKLLSSGLNAEEDNTLLLQRKIFRDGKNSCFINGSSVTVSMLKSIAFSLINIHGQRDSGALLDSEKHIYFLDEYAETENEKADFLSSFEELNKIKEKIRSLTLDEAYKARRLDLLNFQIEELRSANVQSGEISLLRHKKAILNNSLKVTEALSHALSALLGDGDIPGADSLLSGAAGHIFSVTDVAKDLRVVGESLENAKESVLDAASVIDDVLGQLTQNEDNIEEIEERLDQLYRLSKKYGETEDEMLSFLAEAENELDNIVFAEEKIEKLSAEYEKLSEITNKKAEALSKKRCAAANTLSVCIENELKFLDMPNARFIISIKDSPLGENGKDSVEFLISANPGEEPKALGKVASGGELSRIMLAIKNVLSSSEGASSLIFDEIDQGVSGSAAGKIALKLSYLSKNVQVLCVTHSAQIAAFADEHKFLSKSVKNGKTFTEITSLDLNARAKELARITYGSDYTESQLASASEMINRANEQKKTGGTI
ncbi:MAG: DNA repair protein RecN [Oscillospiraceae bacterium]|nr:DNA repair protein RecN [Oscillospiraceae bacterium]